MKKIESGKEKRFYPALIILLGLLYPYISEASGFPRVPDYWKIYLLSLPIFIILWIVLLVLILHHRRKLAALIKLPKDKNDINPVELEEYGESNAPEKIKAIISFCYIYFCLCWIPIGVNLYALVNSEYSSESPIFVLSMAFWLPLIGVAFQTIQKAKRLMAEGQKA